MLRTAHQEANAVLSGNAEAVAIQGGQVMLGLAPLIDSAKQQLGDAGFTAVNSVPEVHPTVPIADATTVVNARTAYTALNSVASWLPWVSLSLIAADAVGPSRPAGWASRRACWSWSSADQNGWSSGGGGLTGLGSRPGWRR